jgi:uncharacterized membrane protein HdeD (DUF308 family)
MILEALSRNWWMLALRGLCAVVFGILAFAKPGITLSALVLVFGAYALVDGILAIVAAISRRGGAPWWALVLEGVAGIGAAAFAFLTPGITALALLFLIASWAIITGVLEVVAAIALRKQLRGEWLLVLSGLASILFGVLLVARPGAGALAVLWLIGGYAIVFGVLLIALGFRLKGLGSHLATPARA